MGTQTYRSLRGISEQENEREDMKAELDEEQRRETETFEAMLWEFEQKIEGQDGDDSSSLFSQWSQCF